MRVPEISVVMSVYNGERYLAESIQSILDQTFSDFEFIIIDDGSTDGSLDILQFYMKKDDRIILMSRENKGLIASLNEGICLAKGKYIARMDADDVSYKKRFEKQIRFLEANTEVGVCGSWVKVFGESIKTKLWKMPITDNELKPRLIFSVPFAHPSVMMRSGLIKKLGLRYNQDYKNAEDYKFWLDLSDHTRFVNIPEVLIKYRYHIKSVSRVADADKNEERFLTISRIQCEALSKINFKPTDDERKNIYLAALNDRILNNGIDLIVLNKCFYEILGHNEEFKCFDDKSLCDFLARKFFISTILSFKKNKLVFFRLKLSRLFFLGGFLTIKDKLGSKFGSVRFSSWRAIFTVFF